MRTSIHLTAFVAFAALVAGCGPTTGITVQGDPLYVDEQIYNINSDMPFCDGLDMVQYEVMISDFAVCPKLHAMDDNRDIFHGSDEANLRMVIPGSPGQIKVTQANVFTVGSYNCNGGARSPNDLEAVAYFSHQKLGGGVYDVDVPADSGTITITKLDNSAEVMTGSFDLQFGTDHVTGTINANICSVLTPAFGWM